MVPDGFDMYDGNPENRDLPILEEHDMREDGPLVREAYLKQIPIHTR
jgi:hypothetical protein